MLGPVHILKSTDFWCLKNVKSQYGLYEIGENKITEGYSYGSSLSQMVCMI